MIEQENDKVSETKESYERKSTGGKRRKEESESSEEEGRKIGKSGRNETSKMAEREQIKKAEYDKNL